MILLLVIIAITLIAAMTVAWLIQRQTGNSGWVDTIWSTAVGVGALEAILLAPEATPARQWIAGGVVLVWSLRLAWHIGTRSAGAGEDPRYARLVEEWGDNYASKMFWFLQIQAFAGFILAIAVYAAVTVSGAVSWFDWLALGVAIVAIAGETIADRQLTAFRKENHGKGAVCEKGLWSWSRHPNYFFEWLFWCSWPIMALAAGLSAPLHIVVALLAPALMYWLLVHASGIPPLEEHMLKSRGDAFRDYQKRVSAFFPLPSSKSSSKES